MPNEDDPIEFPEDEETEEITQQAEANPELLPEPSASKEGILDEEDPGSFEELVSRGRRRPPRRASPGRRFGSDQQPSTAGAPAGTNPEGNPRHPQAATSTSTASTSHSGRSSGAPTSSLVPRQDREPGQGPVGLPLRGGEHQPLGKAEWQDPQPAAEGGHLHAQRREAHRLGRELPGHRLHDDRGEHQRPRREGHLRGLPRTRRRQRNVLLRPPPLGVAAWAPLLAGSRIPVS